MDMNNNLKLGYGVYSMPDVSRILGLRNSLVNKWVSNFWDDAMGKQFESKYSWTVDSSKAINFHTLVEMYTFYQLSSVGVKSPRIIEAHTILANQYNTPFPFAHSEILDGINTDGRKVYFETTNREIYSLDVSKQFSLDFIRIFFKKLDFDANSLASKLWPLGKKNSILCDPARKFGLPVIDNTNVYPETIYSMYMAGDKIKFLAEVYQLTTKQVKNAIEFCKGAA